MRDDKTAGEQAKFNLPESRRHLGLEAAWEIDSLASTLQDACRDLGAGDDDQVALMRLKLQIRGLSVRTQNLASVLMSVFDDDDTTDNLSRKVYGAECAPAR